MLFLFHQVQYWTISQEHICLFSNRIFIQRSFQNHHRNFNLPAEETQELQKTEKEDMGFWEMKIFVNNFEIYLDKNSIWF